MPWDHVADQVPALAALCFLVVSLVGAAGLFLWRVIRRLSQALEKRDEVLQGITEKYMEAMTVYMSEVRELSVTCHASHREVADVTTGAIDRNTSGLDALQSSQHEMALIMREVSTLLRQVNGIRG